VLDRNIGATAVATADEAAVAEAATVSQKMPSYGDYVEFSILLLRSTQASAPKSILWLSLKALLAIEKLVNFCLLPSGSFTVSLP
jgi:hypothetical protein